MIQKLKTGVTKNIMTRWIYTNENGNKNMK